MDSPKGTYRRIFPVRLVSSKNSYYHCEWSRSRAVVAAAAQVHSTWLAKSVPSISPVGYRHSPLLLHVIFRQACVEQFNGRESGNGNAKSFVSAARGCVVCFGPNRNELLCARVLAALTECRLPHPAVASGQFVNVLFGARRGAVSAVCDLLCSAARVAFRRRPLFAPLSAFRPLSHRRSMQ